MLLAKLRLCTDIVLELLTRQFYGITVNHSLFSMYVGTSAALGCVLLNYVSLLEVEVGQPCSLLCLAPLLGSLWCAGCSYKHHDALGINLGPICGLAQYCTTLLHDIIQGMCHGHGSHINSRPYVWSTMPHSFILYILVHFHATSSYVIHINRITGKSRSCLMQRLAARW